MEKISFKNEVMDISCVPERWRKDWEENVIRGRDLNNILSPFEIAMYNIKIGQLIAINEQEEIDNKELKKKIRKEIIGKIRREVKTEFITNTLKKSKLTIEEIANRYSVSVKFVLNIKKQMLETEGSFAASES